LSGRLFSFEGIDGAGKTTQVALLRESLQERGHRVVCLREPGGTVLGERIRGLLLDRSEDPPSPLAELLLFSAARAQLVATRVRPELESGAIVILDRFADATFAYQGFGRGLPLHQILSLEGIAAGIAPDRTWYLDLDPEESARRRAARGAGRFQADAGHAQRGKARRAGGSAQSGFGKAQTRRVHAGTIVVAR
jgi:dTMP kinase